MTDISVTVGDVIHFVDPATATPLSEFSGVDSPGGVFIAEQSPPSISQLLASSRDAHRRFRESSGSVNTDGTPKTAPDDVTAAAAIRAALDARLIAQATDPTHTDPAWADDVAANRGVSSHDLTEFYRNYLS